MANMTQEEAFDILVGEIRKATLKKAVGEFITTKYSPTSYTVDFDVLDIFNKPRPRRVEFVDIGTGFLLSVYYSGELYRAESFSKDKIEAALRNLKTWF